MKRRDALPELLAPAGDFDCLVAAVKGGADAVYLGAKSFNARAFAGNFDDEGMRRAVEYCHLFGVKLYVTLNTLLLPAELSEALSLARRLYSLGVDALIVADIGLVKLLRDTLPELELHASTQMSVHNTAGADMAYRLGCKRVVLARELSGKCIAAVTEKCQPEVEVFLHGALCVCHSGQCLFSSLVGGRSGNRGECAQPCRLPDKSGAYPLSLKDLSLAAHIRELVDSGVSSLKIEGRMKSPDYVYTVTSIYRRLLDECRNASREEHDRLAKAFSRSGFTDGYFVGELRQGMIGVRSSEDKRASREASVGRLEMDKVSVSAGVRICDGEPSLLTLTVEEGALAGRSVTVCGEAPSQAKTAPLTPEGVRARISKMGGTPLLLDESSVEVTLGEGLNMSPAALNALRRAAVESLLSQCRATAGEVQVPEYRSDYSHAVGRSALFLLPSLYAELLHEGALEAFSACFVPLWRLGELSQADTPNGVYLPPVIMEDESDEVYRMLGVARERGVKYALVGNLGAIELARRYGLIPIGDFRLNVTNPATRAALSELGIEDAMLSPELTLRYAREVGGRVIVCGRIPLMLTERCFIRDRAGCDRCNGYYLTDRRGVRFPIVREWRHRNLILNSAPTYMGDRREHTREWEGLAEHFIFTTERADDARAILRAYLGGESYPFDAPFRRMGRRDVR